MEGGGDGDDAGTPEVPMPWSELRRWRSSAAVDPSPSPARASSSDEGGSETQPHTQADDDETQPPPAHATSPPPDACATASPAAARQEAATAQEAPTPRAAAIEHMRRTFERALSVELDKVQQRLDRALARERLPAMRAQTSLQCERMTPVRCTPQVHQYNYQSAYAQSAR